MEKLIFFFGIEVVDINNGICLCQKKYCLELIHESGMLGCKPIKTALDTNVIIRGDGLDKNGCLVQNVVLFQKLGRKLIYLTINRPDISYCVQVLS